MKLAPIPNHILLPSDMELRRIASNHRIRKPDDCNTCGGQKTFRFWNEDRTEVVDWECNCEDQYVLSLYFASRGISRRDSTISWADMTAVPQAGIEWRNNYLSNADAFVRNGFGAVLIGDSGTGKSALVNLMLRTLMFLGYDGYFIRYPSLLDWVPKTWQDEEEDHFFKKRVVNAGVLVIDDLGGSTSEIEKSSPEFAMRAIDNILRHRLSVGVPTFITSRLSADKLQSIFGQSISDLIRESSSIHVLRGESFRHTGEDPFVADIKNGMSRPVVFG